ncbi:porin [Nitrincola tapanii]|uniref:Porin n=1 Tax=Nitrincola tapanii TaxID=1708751 RepID=A0A5A9W6C7_9GAMM|nr:porin [Nitrincola tapanii]KAA0875091.1 porin [Nitrincola tapanii]
MKKSLIAMAVAGAIAAPAIAQADATLFGTFEMFMQKERGASAELVSDSYIGIMGTVDLGLEDTKGIFKWEQGLDLNAGALADGDETYIGATGSWGTVMGGKTDLPSVYMVSDYTDITYQGTYESALGQAFALQSNSLSYVSPEFAGVTFAAAGVFGGENTSFFAGEVDASSGEKDKTFDAYNLGVQYDANGIYAAAAYGKAKTAKFGGDYFGDFNVWGLAAGFSGIENLDLRASYERGKEKALAPIFLGSDLKATTWNLSAQYDIADTAVYAVYGETKFSANGGSEKGASYTLGVAQTMGNGAVYAEFMDFRKDYKGDSLLNDLGLGGDKTFLVGYQLNF